MQLPLKINQKKNKKNSDKEWIDKTITTIVFVVPVCAYAYCMLVHPWIKSFDWAHVHEVWMSWQSLNVGVLAFISTFFIYKATTHSENAKRKRNFKAEKAFLPNALSELTRYLEKNSRYLEHCLNAVKNETEDMNPKISVGLPSLPIKHEDVFRRCIVTASDDVADYLSGILMRLQIFTARMKGVDDYFKNREYIIQTKCTIESRTCDLIEIHILTTNLFDFARSTKEFSNIKINREDIANSVLNLKIAVGRENEMVALVEKHLDDGGIMN